MHYNNRRFNARTINLEVYVHVLGTEWTAPKRYERDSMIKTIGRTLIDICETTDMCVVNGRIGNDSNVGEITCNT